MGVQRVLALVGNAIAEYVGLQVGTGPASAGQLVALNASGLIDTTMAPLSLPPSYTSRAAAMADFIPTSVSALRIKGWSKPGDGGEGDFVRMDGSTTLLTPPTSLTAQLWHFQTADGAWWLRYTEGPVNFQMFGALGGGSDDTAAIQAALNYHPVVFAARALPVRILMLPESHLVSQPLTCLSPSPSLKAAGGVDDGVYIARTNFAGHTMEFGNATTGCQRLEIEGIHFDMPVDGKWVDGAGNAQASYTDGAVILSMSSLTSGNKALCRVSVDRPHQLTNGMRVYLSQTNTTVGGPTAYENRAFIANVLSTTDILLFNLDCSPFYSSVSQTFTGDGSTTTFYVVHDIGSYLVSTAYTGAIGGTTANLTPNESQVAFATAPAVGTSITVTCGVPNIVAGAAGVTSGPLCSKVFVPSTPNYAASVVAVTQANPCVATFSAAHQYTPGDMVVASALTGMTQLNGIPCLVQSVTSTTVTLYQTSLTPLDSSDYGTYAGGGNFSVVPQALPTYATATLSNIMPGGGPYAHVKAWYPAFGRMARVQAVRTNAPIWFVGDSYCTFEDVKFGGIYDDTRPGLQETIAGLYFPFNVMGIRRTLPTIHRIGLTSLGVQSPPQLKRWGNATRSARKDVNAQDGIYCEDAEGFDVHAGYIGAQNRSCIRFNPAAGSVNVHIKLHHFFCDGSGEASIHFAVGAASVENVIIDHIDANGGDFATRFLQVDDATGILPQDTINSLTVDHVVGQGYLCAPISLLNVSSAAIDGCIFNGYNQLGSTNGDPTISAGAYVGPHCGLVTFAGGGYGGAINATLGSNFCQWGVYDASGSASLIGVRSGSLGMSGGGVSNVAQLTDPLTAAGIAAILGYVPGRPNSGSGIALPAAANVTSSTKLGSYTFLATSGVLTATGDSTITSSMTQNAQLYLVLTDDSTGNVINGPTFAETAQANTSVEIEAKLEASVTIGHLYTVDLWAVNVSNINDATMQFSSNYLTANCL